MARLLEKCGFPWLSSRKKNRVGDKLSHLIFMLDNNHRGSKRTIQSTVKKSTILLIFKMKTKDVE